MRVRRAARHESEAPDYSWCHRVCEVTKCPNLGMGGSLPGDSMWVWLLPHLPQGHSLSPGGVTAEHSCGLALHHGQSCHTALLHTCGHGEQCSLSLGRMPRSQPGTLHRPMIQTLVPLQPGWEQLCGSCPASSPQQHPSAPSPSSHSLSVCPRALWAAPGHDFSPLPIPSTEHCLVLQGRNKENRVHPCRGCRCLWDLSLCEVHTPKGRDPELHSTTMLSLQPLAGV